MEDLAESRGQSLGARASALAGLHAYFFLAIAQRVRRGDYGALITSAEWLDVRYGMLIRDLFVNRLGGLGVYVIEPKAEPFPGTATTGAITTLSVGSAPRSARFSRGGAIPAGEVLAAGREVPRDKLSSESRWSDPTRILPRVPDGLVELGELFRVHRGQVTGANHIWIAGEHSSGLPDELLFPTVTKARELFECGPALTDSSKLRRVIDLPADLSTLDKASRENRGQELLCRAPPTSLVVSSPSRACADTGNIHGTPLARIRSQQGKGQALEYRPRSLSQGTDGRICSVEAGRLVK